MSVVQQIGHIRLSINCAANLDSQANAVLTKIAVLHSGGSQLRDGSTIQFGWTVFTLQKENGGLTVCEPAFEGNALGELKNSADISLGVLTEQVAVLHKVGESGFDICFSDYLISAQGALHARRIYLQRKQPMHEDSGWYIGDVEHPELAHDKEQLLSLRMFELWKLLPSALRVLALPPGFLVVMEGDEIKSIVDPEDRERWTKCDHSP